MPACYCGGVIDLYMYIPYSIFKNATEINHRVQSLSSI